MTPPSCSWFKGRDCDRAHHPPRTVPALAAPPRRQQRSRPHLPAAGGHGGSHGGADLAGGALPQRGAVADAETHTVDAPSCTSSQQKCVFPPQGKYSIHVYSVNGCLLSSFTSSEQVTALHLVSEYIILGTMQGSLHIRDLHRCGRIVAVFANDDLLTTSVLVYLYTFVLCRDTRCVWTVIQFSICFSVRLFLILVFPVLFIASSRSEKSGGGMCQFSQYE